MDDYWKLKMMQELLQIVLHHTTYETEVKDFFDIDRHVGVLSP